MSIYSILKNPFLKLNPTQIVSPILSCNPSRQLHHNTAGIPATAEIKAAPPFYKPKVSPEISQVTNVWKFDTIPTEKPSDPWPLTPGPNPGPDFPRPPSPSPPIPEGPRPPLPPPTGPDVFPPHGPDVIPPKPPEPGPPHPIKPDIPPPILGSNEPCLSFGKLLNW